MKTLITIMILWGMVTIYHFYAELAGPWIFIPWLIVTVMACRGGRKLYDKYIKPEIE
jgi:hypothetical protein